MKLLLATQNHHKVREISHGLEPHGIVVADLSGFPDHPPLIEDGDTFVDNARKKAWTMAKYSGLLTLADDSGLEVDALGGAPGVHSARFAGEPSNDDANNRKLIAALQGVPRERRTARYQCVLVLADPKTGGEQIFSGCCEGRILEAPRGTGGFGYDPYFIVPSLNQTMAEIPLERKNQISHRGQALQKLFAYFNETFKK